MYFAEWLGLDTVSSDFFQVWETLHDHSALEELVTVIYETSPLRESGETYTDRSLNFLLECSRKAAGLRSLNPALVALEEYVKLHQED